MSGVIDRLSPSHTWAAAGAAWRGLHNALTQVFLALTPLDTVCRIPLQCQVIKCTPIIAGAA